MCLLHTQWQIKTLFMKSRSGFDFSLRVVDTIQHLHSPGLQAQLRLQDDVHVEEGQT